MTVEKDGVPFARIDAWPKWNEFFTHALAWKRLIVLGVEEHVYLIDPITREVSSVACDRYFGHAYPVDGQLLIADATRLVRINERGELLWESATLGIDGVVVDNVQDGVIIGPSEWDPPGGWKPFR